MGWVDKLPTFKGVVRFFYVATHWDTISRDFDQYRKQIDDRDQWNKALREMLSLGPSQQLEHKQIAEWHESFSRALMAPSVDPEWKRVLSEARAALNDLKATIEGQLDKCVAFDAFVLLFILSQHPQSRRAWLMAFPESTRMPLVCALDRLDQDPAHPFRTASLPASLLTPDGLQEVLSGLPRFKQNV